MVSAAISARLATTGAIADTLPEPAVGALAFATAAIVVVAAIVVTLRREPLVEKPPRRVAV